MRANRPALLAAWLGLAAAACGSAAPGHGDGAQLSDGGQLSDAAPIDSDADAGAPPRDGGADMTPAPPPDPQFVGLRLLSDSEYANTVTDLLGVTLPNGAVFPPSGLSSGPIGAFDNQVGAAPSTWRYGSYFQAAFALADATFSDPELAARILTCAPADPSDTSCAASIVRAFGRRAWRRPLDDGEIADLVALAGDARAAGETFAGSIERVVTAMLASESFLYRVELDPASDPQRVHPVGAYELASRLSYLLWSTMPDARLFELADSGELLRADVVLGEVPRMLADPRARGFVHDFAGQWLGFRALESHDVDSVTFPEWSDDLRRATEDEAVRYVTDYLQNDRSLTTFLIDDEHFVNDALAGVYGLPAPGATTELVATHGTPNGRKGYLGLAAFLTATSRRATTSPSMRGASILGSLLCVELGTPPASSPTLAGSPRQQLAMLAAIPGCAGCHVAIDDVGLGLESFDAIGGYRTKYAPDDFLEIDPTGNLPDGTGFVGLSELADLLQRDPRFLDCAARKALVYAIGRPLGDGDEPQLAAVRSAWERSGLTFRGLLSAIVTSDVFRFRRGEAP